MYAIGSFLAPFMMRVHGTKRGQCRVYFQLRLRFAGIPGMILGGLIGDAILHRRRNGPAAGCLDSIGDFGARFFFAIPLANWFAFSVLFGVGCACLYVYFATVYSTIQDVIEPSLRATAHGDLFLFHVPVWRSICTRSALASRPSK